MTRAHPGANSTVLNACRERFDRNFIPILKVAYGAALHLTHCREEAEDLVQETALQAFIAFPRFQEGTNFKAWFLHILINRFRNTYRKRKREPMRVSLIDVSDVPLQERDSGTAPTVWNTDPAVLIEGRISEQQIEAALAALPGEIQIVSVLYFIEEMSYQEIAEAVGCPIGTVRSRLHRGRKLLREALQPALRENEEHGISSTRRMEQAEKAEAR